MVKNDGPVANRPGGKSLRDDVSNPSQPTAPDEPRHATYLSGVQKDMTGPEDASATSSQVCKYFRLRERFAQWFLDEDMAVAKQSMAAQFKVSSLWCYHEYMRILR